MLSRHKSMYAKRTDGSRDDKEYVPAGRGNLRRGKDQARKPRIGGWTLSDSRGGMIWCSWWACVGCSSRVACRSSKLHRGPIRKIPDRTIPCLCLSLFRLKLISNVAKIERGQGQEERAYTTRAARWNDNPFVHFWKKVQHEPQNFPQKFSENFTSEQRRCVAAALINSLRYRAVRCCWSTRNSCRSDPRRAAWCTHPPYSHHRVYRQFGLHLLKYRVTYLVSCFVVHYHSLFRSLTTPFTHSGSCLNINGSSTRVSLTSGDSVAVAFIH
ncbi:hypothetical protein PHSY_007448 [Pseudozyma hubeiensis SY62]|uniref:Uncharacterized protein n=1 Tax=Pseudozyma hubeiensis (strain SY62) TaxID=1305764 RepID=R9PP31_PSEHS|nr:hypothetical protein PHSY_007448 [Pseudozyma hubeiensis SY62]GAC99845.1 hypothetical protein PHSY_007448 [Pseudozyma hubeiensis SY62]